MSLLDAPFRSSLRWSRIGDAYEVTRKPRNLDVASLETVPFVPMDTIPQGGAYHPGFTLKPPNELKSGTYFERGDILLAKITPSFENGKQALAIDLPAPFGYATTEVIPLRPRNRGHDPRLLFFYLLHPDIRHHIAERMEGATGRQRVPQDVLLDTQYPEFEPREQAVIAECLEMVQRMIVVEEAKREVLKGLFVSLLDKLMTGEIRTVDLEKTAI